MQFAVPVGADASWVPGSLPHSGMGREMVHDPPGTTPRRFNVWTEHKRMEKLCYAHRNPVKRAERAAGAAAVEQLPQVCPRLSLTFVRIRSF